jgi:hypothetical protein
VPGGRRLTDTIVRYELSSNRAVSYRPDTTPIRSIRTGAKPLKFNNNSNRDFRYEPSLRGFVFGSYRIASFIRGFKGGFDGKDESKNRRGAYLG